MEREVVRRAVCFRRAATPPARTRLAGRMEVAATLPPGASAGRLRTRGSLGVQVTSLQWAVLVEDVRV